MIETSMCCIVFFPFKITASKILVTTGQDIGGHQTTSQVIDFTAKCNMGIEDCTNCKNWPNFPKHVSGTTSGLLGNTVMICGGFNNDVFDIQSGKPIAKIIAMMLGNIEVSEFSINTGFFILL